MHLVRVVVMGNQAQFTLPHIADAHIHLLHIGHEGGFVLDDFVLRNISFSNEYAASVEQKQIAFPVPLSFLLLLDLS